ncbi:MAG: RluA family pseudouridine synthase [Firmicutes bacterium]|jgi:23S rRNA pseudouridine1911/1915/1917 synthase|nr:RluA family pseudouridine synthase [Bacillota bacterium]
MNKDDRNTLTTYVLPQEDGLMVKDIIYGRLDLSRGLLRRMKRGGGVYLNGKRDFITRRVTAGDELKIVFYDEPTTMEPQNIPLDIVFEDDYLLAINKPAGMAVHPTGAYQEGTLANAIAYYWQTIGIRTKVRLVHRIDKDTSGLVLVAKEPYSLHGLLQQLSDGKLAREYLALVEGHPSPSQGMIEAPIGRSLDHGVKRAIQAQGKWAQTYYETIRFGKKYSLLRVRLGSGRTHQIRVHMASIGHPLVGDPLYNKPIPQAVGQVLHAWRLTFSHPRTHQVIRLWCPVPKNVITMLQQGI